jgi:hypothetical protein
MQHKNRYVKQIPIIEKGRSERESRVGRGNKRNNSNQLK